MSSYKQFEKPQGCYYSRHATLQLAFFFTLAGNCQTYQTYQQPPQILPNSVLQSHFSAMKISGIFLFFFPLNNIRQGDHLEMFSFHVANFGRSDYYLIL